MQTIHHEAIDYLISVCKFSDFNGAQKDILNKEFLDYSSNYIVSTHTGTGKTALAQLRIVDALKKSKKVIFISPYKAIAEEKRQDFEFYNKYGWSSISSANPNEIKDNTDYSKFDLISMTYEKFDSVLNNARFINGWLKKVGLVVVDEGHMISDLERGPTLESAITKVITIFKKKIIILMLSAVLPNVSSIANWLSAKYGTSNWRPVDLQVGFAIYGNNVKKGNLKRNSTRLILEHIKNEVNSKEILVKYGSLNAINKIIYANNTNREKDENKDEKLIANQMNQTTYLPNTEFSNSPLSISNYNNIFEKTINNNLEKTITTSANASLNAIYKVLDHEQRAKDVDNPLWFLSEQTIKDNGQVLIFSTDRASTETIASNLAYCMYSSKSFHKYISPSEREEIENNFVSKMKIKDEKLISVMTNGVAFHHAGLDLQKRKLIEDAYKEGKIKILLSTTTLIAGVNLPATLVIFDSLSFWNGNRKQIMSKRDFLNGCGRAGRPGLETRGRALIMANSLLPAVQFIARPLEKIESQFGIDTLVFQTLAIIKRNADSGQKYTSIKDIDNFFKNSFYFSNGFKIDINNYLNQLLNMELISIYKESQKNSSSNTKRTFQDYINKIDENNVKEHINQDNFYHHYNKEEIRYMITSLGYETIRFYLNPRTGYLIRNMLFALDSHLSNKNYETPDIFVKISTPNKISLLSIIHTLIHAKELQNLWKTTKLKKDEKEFVKDHVEEIMLNRSMYFNENLSEDERKCLCTTMAFYEKLNMQDISQKSRFESMYQRFGRGDFTSLQENMEWLVGASLKIAQVILLDIKNREIISKMLLTLSRRINAGMVKEDLLELCLIKEIGRIRSFTLANAGINSIKKLINPYNKHTIDNILGSEQLTKRIIENAKKNIENNYKIK